MPSKDRQGMKVKQLEDTKMQSCLALDATDDEKSEAHDKGRDVWALKDGNKQEKDMGVIHTLNGTTNSRTNNN